ncbi:MAG: hypothetical protein NTU85_00170 [Candidatus Kaiserbacteria bacterium]|nr:hypothetical protein [Candidatus Kaiserbacteria bacterium]
MKNKIKSIVVILIAVMAGYLISHPIVFHICANTYKFNDYTGCLDSSIKSIGFPLLIFSLWVLLATFVAIFFSEKIFRSWLKFVAWAIPLAIIFIAITPVSSTAVMDFFPFYRDDAARLAGEVFSVISLIIIIWKWIVSRKNKGLVDP